MGISEVLGHFLKRNLTTGPWNLVYRHIVGIFMFVWKITPVGKNFGSFLVPNKAKIGQYLAFRLFSWKFSAGFIWHFIYKLVGSFFVGVENIGPKDPTFGAIWGHQKSQNSGLETFCWKASSEFTSILLYMLIGATFRHVYNMGHKCSISILGGFEVSKNSGVLSLSQNFFTGFTSVLLHMLIASNFRCLENMGIRGPIFGPLWVPK